MVEEGAALTGATGVHRFGAGYVVVGFILKPL